MLQALVRTITELLDSKKAAYSFAAAVGACVLHVYYKVPVQDALLLVSPLGLATAAQAHVDAAEAKIGASTAAAAEVKGGSAATPATPPASTPTP